jgi:IS1 family transposase
MQPLSRLTPPTIHRRARRARGQWKSTSWKPSSGGKSQPISVTLAVARDTRLIVGQQIMWTVDLETMQPFADALPAVGRYCTDGAAVYGEVIWPEDAWHVVSIAKEETFTIEGINADVRTYLGRLKRRSRCFSRSVAKLAEAVRLFVWHYNRRRRAININPAYRDALPLLF